MRVGERVLDARNPALDKALPILGGIVFGILGDIAVQAGLANGRDGRRTVHGLKPLQLASEPPGAGHG